MMFRLFGRLRHIFTKRSEEFYVDALQAAEGDSLDEQHARALLENRQREAFRKTCLGGRSILMGYKVPDLFVEDRISVHARREGWVPPSEKKRVIKVTAPASSIKHHTK